MFARFSHYRIKPENIEPMVRQIRDDFYPNYLAKLPGLIAYNLVGVTANEVISLTVWDSEEAAEASVAIAGKYVRENMVGTFEEVIHSGTGPVLLMRS